MEDRGLDCIHVAAAGHVLGLGILRIRDGLSLPISSPCPSPIKITEGAQTITVRQHIELTNPIIN